MDESSAIQFEPVPLEIDQVKGYLETLHRHIKATFSMDSTAFELCNLSRNIHGQIGIFHDKIKQIPISSAIAVWIKEISVDSGWGKQYIWGINQVLEKKLLLLENQGKSRVLGEFMPQDHLLVFEEIRCVKQWSYTEQEKIAYYYWQFSRSLATLTLNLIPFVYDPVKRQVENKIVPFDRFLEFAQHLSKRDAVIAKLLYFGAPLIEEVLDLQIEAIDFRNYTIKFSSGHLPFPRHVIRDIKLIFESQSGKSGLVFRNVKGERVERAHLTQAFARASQHKEAKEKITPGMLIQTNR